jgi:hypothetical protein
MPVDATVHPLDIDKKSTSLENPGPIKIESIMYFLEELSLRYRGAAVGNVVLTRPKMATIKDISLHHNVVTGSSGSILSISRNTSNIGSPYQNLKRTIGFWIFITL